MANILQAANRSMKDVIDLFDKLEDKLQVSINKLNSRFTCDSQ